MFNLLPDSITINGELLSRGAIMERFHSFENVDETIDAKVFRFLAQWLDQSPTLVIKTSGSTGKPKEIFVEKERMLASANMTGDYFGLKNGDTALLCLSPDYVAGKMMIVRALQFGLNLIISKETSCPLKDINQMVNFAAMVPLQVANILKKHPSKFNLLENLIIGGSSITNELERKLQDIKTNCWHTYAMTETLTHVALRKVNGPGRSQWFSPLPGIKICLDDRDCLVIDAPILTTQKVITNDIGLIDGNNFKVLCRFDDVIISAGFKLHPSLIESKLENLIHMPFFITSETHVDAAQNLVIFVEDQNLDLDLSYIGAQFKILLEKPEIPRRIFALPKFKYLESGKIDKFGTKMLADNY